MGAEIYLDNNATTAVRPEAVSAMLAVLRDHCGNPSSEHAAGAKGRALIASAREHVAALIGAEPRQIIFTSGATEANNQVLASAATWVAAPRIVTTTCEHLSGLAPCRVLASHGAQISAVGVARDGVARFDELADAVTPETALVSVHWVNGETGVIQPIAEIAELCRSRGVPLHTDAAQAVGKLPVDVAQVPVDFLSLSGHKLHAPAGVGALFVRNPAALASILHGGPQERGSRAGTENIVGIAGLGAAASARRANLDTVVTTLRALRDRFEAAIGQAVPGARVNGRADGRACNTTNVRFEGLDGSALVARLDAAGVRCSQSSACTSMRPEPSHVLLAMGLSEDEAQASVRFALSEWTTQEELDATVEEIAAAARAIRAFCGRLGSARRQD